VPSSREFLREQLRSWGADDLEPDAGLLLTELVANVLRHAHTPLSVRVEWDPPNLRVEVCDGSLEMPEIAAVADEGGYGLQIVASLAADWGVERRDHDKIVWFVMTQRA